jgi:hypothetical protein
MKETTMTLIATNEAQRQTALTRLAGDILRA